MVIVALSLFQYNNITLSAVGAASQIIISIMFYILGEFNTPLSIVSSAVFITLTILLLYILRSTQTRAVIIGLIPGILTISQLVMLSPFQSTSPSLFSAIFLIVFSGIASWLVCCLALRSKLSLKEDQSTGNTPSLKNAIAIFATLALTATFFHNSKHDLTKSNEKEIVRHEHFSEALVIGRVLRAEINGLGSNGALLGWAPSENDLTSGVSVMPNSTEKLFELDNKIEKNSNLLALEASKIRHRQFIRYTGNAGFQGDVFAIINIALTKLKLNGKDRLLVLRSLSILLTSLSIAVLCMTIARRFGWIEGAFVFLIFLFSPWFGLFSSNLYWIPFLWLWPMIYTMWRFVPISPDFRVSDKPLPRFQTKDFIILTILILANALTGLEFMTCVLISACLPVLIASCIKQKWKLFFINGFKASFATLVGLGVGILLFLFKISFSLGGGAKSVESFFGRIEKRSQLSETSELSAAILSSELPALLRYFLTDAKLLASGNSTITMMHFLICFSVLFLAATLIRIFSSKITLRTTLVETGAILILTLIAILGPISWLIVGSGHSQFHPYIVPLIFHLPALVMLPIFLGIQFRASRTTNPRLVLGTIFCSFALIVVISKAFTGWKYQSDRKVDKLQSNYSDSVVTIRQFENDLELTLSCDFLSKTDKVLIDTKQGARIRSKFFNASTENIKEKIWLPVKRAPSGLFNRNDCRFISKYGGYGIESLSIGIFDEDVQIDTITDITPIKVHTVKIPTPAETIVKRSKREDRQFSDGISGDRMGIFLNRRDVNPQSLAQSKVIIIDGQGEYKIGRIYVEQHYVLIRVTRPLPPDIPRHLKVRS